MTHGQCLCGAVELKVEKLGTSFGACHCNMCRNWGGGPYLSVDCGQKVTVTGKESVTVYRSSDWAERAFCTKCGSHLYYRWIENDQYFVPIGLLDDAEKLPFTHQIFVDEKPETYTFANETSHMTGAEVFAQFNKN